MFGRNFSLWRRMNFYTTDWGGYTWVPHTKMEADILKRFNMWAFTVDDSELPKTKSPQIIDRFYELQPHARELYDAMFEELVAEAEDDVYVIAANAAVRTGKLLQIASGFLYEPHTKVIGLDHNGLEKVKKWNTTHIIHDELMDTLGDLIDEEIPDDEPTLIAYWFDATQQRIRVCWPDMPFLDGTNDAELLRAWNNKEIMRLAVHPAAAGHGLNFQYGGRYLVMAEPMWDAELYEQMIGRIARQGQELQPYIYRLAAKRTLAATGCIPVCERRLTAQAAVMAAIRKI